MASEQDTQRGIDRLLNALDTWGPVMAALVESERSMREARFILLGGHGALLERADQAVAVLEAGIAQAQEVSKEDDDLDQLTLEEEAR